MRFRELPPPTFEWDLRLAAATDPVAATDPTATAKRAPQPESIVGGQGEISGIVLLDGEVYWSSRESGEVRRATRAGAVEVVATGLDRCALVGVLGGELCVSHRAGGGVAVSCVPRGGGALRDVATTPSWAPTVAVAHDVLVMATTQMAAYRGGATTPLADGALIDAVVVTPPWVYYSVAGAVKRVPLGGGAAETIRTVPDLRTYDMGANATHVFWAEQEPEHELWRVALAGGDAEKVAWLPELPMQIAADDRAVYLGTWHAIYEVDVAGGTPRQRARAARATQMAMDDRRLCWASYDEQQVVCQEL
jgi:hypothetical protein